MKSNKWFALLACCVLCLGEIDSAIAQSASFQWIETCPNVGYVDLYAGWWRGRLEGYTDKMSAKQGENLAFKVSVWKDDLQPGSYNVEIYRVSANPTSDEWKATYGPYTSAFQPLHDAGGAPINPNDYTRFPMEYRNGCDFYNWPTAFALAIPTNWPSGFYYAKLILISDPSMTGRIPFVVKEDNPGSTSKILCVIAWNTYQAYNYWGGGSLYWCTGQYESPELNSQNQQVIRTVSLKRPFGLHHHWDDSQYGEEHRYKFVDQLGQLHHREKQFINWTESNGYTIEYAIDLDIHDPTGGLALLNNYKLVVFPGHSEYWSPDQRNNIKNFRTAGGNLAFLAANNCYWIVNFQANNTQMFCDKENNKDWWRKDPVEGPEAQLIGVQFGGVNVLNDSGFQHANIVTNASHWLFAGTGLTNGALFGFGAYSQYSDLNIDPLVAGEADMRATPQYTPSGTDVLARRFIRNLTADPNDVHYNDPSFPFQPSDLNKLYSEVTYYENTTSNARVFASGAHGWCNALSGADGTTMGVITRNLFDHFSYKKYRGNIYAQFLTWGDETLETATILDGDTYILPNKTLSLTNNFLLTINSGVTLYVQGTLVIGSNVTITGGGKIVTSGGGKIYVTSSPDATAYNNSRKLVRDSAGNYHLVFESDGEICYEKWSNSGTAISEFRRLSSGTGSNKFPSIAECSGKLYVFWQRKTGTNTYDTHFRHFTGTSWDNIRNVNTGIASNNDLIPSLAVSTPSALFEMMAVYRTNQGLRSRRSLSSTGASWQAVVPVTNNTSARNPSLIYKPNTEIANANFSLSWDDGNNINHQALSNGSWPSPTIISNGTASVNHQYSSYALSGNGDRHIVWQALEQEIVLKQVVYHKQNLTNIFTAFSSASWDHLRPSITGHAGAEASLLCHDNGSAKNIRKRRFNGTSWEGVGSGSIVASDGADASASIANPPGATALAAWRSAGSAPYALTLGPSGGLSKESANETAAYHRRIVFSLDDSSTLALQMGTVQLLSAGGKNDYTFPFVSNQDSIKNTDLLSTLSLSNLFVPSDADSLVLEVKAYGQEAGNLRGDQSKSLDLGFDLLSVEPGTPVASIPLARLNNTGISRQAARLVFPVQALRGRRVHLVPTVSNVDLAKVNGALVHVYEVLDDGAQKISAEMPSLVAVAQPTSFSVRVYPNPFNPSTQIYFDLPSEGVATVRIYDVNGRIVREVSSGFHKAGNHTVTWDGRDHLGKTVASGIYFSEIRFAEERKVAKIMLVR